MSEGIEKFKSLYETADQFAREVGWLESAVSIPAHNQLRYAGHHISKATGLDGVVDCESENFQKAVNHCERAMYEAAEAGILFLTDEMNSFRKRYKSLVITNVISDYPAKLMVAREARDLVVRGRENRISVTDHVAEYMNKFREMKRVYEELDSCRDELNAAFANQNREHRRYMFGLVVAAAGTFAAVLRLF